MGFCFHAAMAGTRASNYTVLEVTVVLGMLHAINVFRL